jgi:MinD-like ATPase involved in chromosome partitioning or flagellar assembly
MNLLKKVVTSLSQKYEHVILDTAPGLCGHSLGPVLLAEQALIVVTPDPLSQLGAQMLKRTLHVLNPGEKMMLILNMSVEKGGPTVAELQEGIGLNVLGVIPEDREMREAAQSGIPLMIHRPKSKAASAIRAIAEEFLAEEALRAARKSGKD